MPAFLPNSHSLSLWYYNLEETAAPDNPILAAYLYIQPITVVEQQRTELFAFADFFIDLQDMATSQALDLAFNGTVQHGQGKLVYIQDLG